jgi:CHAD domain-containing protein
MVKACHRSLVRAARRIDRKSSPEALHRVRVLAKHLRYCLEFHGPMLGPAAREFVRRLTEIQDQLGEVQDFHVFLDRYARVGEDASVQAGSRALDLLRERTEERRLCARARRRAFSEALASIRGVPWKQLRRELGA